MNGTDVEAAGKMLSMHRVPCRAGLFLCTSTSPTADATMTGFAGLLLPYRYICFGGSAM